MSVNLHSLVAEYAKQPTVAALGKVVGSGSPRVACLSGLQGSSAAVVFAALRERRVKRRPLLFLLNDEEEAGYFYHDLMQLTDAPDLLFFPSSFRRAVKYGQRDAANEILRTDVLNRLAEGADSLAIVTYPAAVSELVADKSDLSAHTIHLERDTTHDLPELEHRLLELGFRRTDYVYEPGEFAVRGSILDVFSFSSEYPYRIDFFGDDIDSIRTFEVQTQLSREQIDTADIVFNISEKETPTSRFTDFLPADTLLVVRNIDFVADTLNQIFDDGFAQQAHAIEADKKAQAEWEIYEDEQAPRKGSPTRSTLQENSGADLDRNSLLTQAEPLMQALRNYQRIELAHRPSDEARTTIAFETTAQPIFHKNFDLLLQSLEQFKAEGYGVYICADSAKQNERLRNIFDEMRPASDSPARAIFTPVARTLHEGFADAQARMCFFTDHQIFDRFHKYSLKNDHARDSKMALTLKELMQFQPGDYLVHIDHGIGQFAGLVRMPASDGSQQEMIKLIYQNDDVVFVSIHALHKLSKYKGKDGTAPRLSKLGTGAWEKMKSRTKKKIKDIARDLIRLYSQRREEKGYAFSHDTFLQHELEAGFAYEDTPDQLRVTQEVKADMESQRPMDRLVCGDVGFGKTEIAVRAALKAAVDNKQVAVLVPTTVLALQHYRTFADRLRDFPVRVEYLSRARSAAQVREIVAGLADGSVQVVIGTHKLIGKSVRFKDLGLLIIDEEQKFGVAVKEKLRQLKTTVDTLTMSATPIPRTLQFSLMGARDLSIIQTPPPNRRPIQTEIHTFHHDIIAEAVNFELARNGQTFIVTNRISALPRLRDLVKKYVPDARVAIGHGQMAPAELERIILDFINHDYDVLISTTIVENGIDIPNVNTILIDAAHKFGLSDLHQMRGRVGRSDRKAFCYLLAPPLSLLKDDARRRLEAIENFSDLGSGIHIAMQDLDIRGAGNLLGAEQSGFIADLGYEAYQKILSEAVSELKNEEFAELYKDDLQQNRLTGDLFVEECNVECDLHAYLPETYVPGAAERMSLYRELDGLSTSEQIDAFRSRMEDRFGPIPLEGEELLRIVPLRQIGRKVGAEKIVLRQSRLVLYFVSNTASPFYQSATFDRIIDYATRHFRQCELKETNGKRRMSVRNVCSVAEALATLEEMAGIR